VTHFLTKEQLKKLEALKPKSGVFVHRHYSAAQVAAITDTGKRVLASFRRKGVFSNSSQTDSIKTTIKPEE
jgi:hypothetical protein